MNILIVDDEKLLRDVVKEYCLNDNYNVYEAENGLEALQVLEKENIDLIVLDIMMPKMDGYTFFKQMKEKENIPTIVLSARGEEYDKLLGFDLGIDDYLTKPFSPKELMMRINAVLTRYHSKETSKEEPETLTFATLKIDLSAHIVYVDDVKIDLTHKEYELLLYLVNNANVAVTREQLLEKVWGYGYYGDDRTLDTHMKSLRKKIGKYSDNIITIRRVGYRFETK